MKLCYLGSILPIIQFFYLCDGRLATPPHPHQKYLGVVARHHAALLLLQGQCCQMAKFDPLLSLDCARVEGVGAQSKERKGSNFAA